MKVTVSIPAVVRGYAKGEYIIDKLPQEFDELTTQEQAWYIESHGNMVSDVFESVKYLDSSYYEAVIEVEND